jgi:hypothetical protein
MATMRRLAIIALLIGGTSPALAPACARHDSRGRAGNPWPHRSPGAQLHARAERLAVVRRLEANVGGSAAFHRGLVLGVAGSFFTLSEIIVVSCITCWLSSAYSAMSR